MPAPLSDKASTRDRILQTAEALFAERGIDAVSMNEINKAAGQKNTSSLHYHFGNKEGLLQAIVYSQYQDIELALQAAMDELERQSGFTAEQLVETLIAPFINKLNSQRGRYYILIVSQLLSKSADLLTLGHPMQEDKARLRAFALFETLDSALTREEKVARMILLSTLLFHSLASYVRFEQRQEANPLGDQAFFIHNLTLTLKSMITA